jgi:FlaA1/EpsC-like NDP-sugar epimerase
MESSSLQIGLIQLSRRTKRLIAIITDATIIVAALAGTLLLVHQQSPGVLFERPALFLAAVAVAIPIFTQQGLYRAIIRFIGSRMVFAVLRSVTLVAAVLAAIGFWLGQDAPSIIISTALIFWAFALLGIVGGRFAMRIYLMRQAMPGERVAIYGAGEAGAHLVAALAGGKQFVPVAFVDDSLSVQGRSINGVQVHHPEALPKLVADLGIKRVLLALPSSQI